MERPVFRVEEAKHGGHWFVTTVERNEHICWCWTEGDAQRVAEALNAPLRGKQVTDENDKLDAARYRWLRNVLETSVCGYVNVNEVRAYYETPEPGEEVAIQWYPDTPVGSYRVPGKTLDEAIDKARGEIVKLPSPPQED